MHLLNHFLYRQRPAAATQRGNNAERTTVTTAVLDLQVRTRAFVSGLKDGCGDESGVGKNIGDEDGRTALGSGPTVDIRCVRVMALTRGQCLQRNKISSNTVPSGLLAQGNLCEIVFVRIAHHAGNVVESRDFLGGALRITAGDNDLSVGITATDAANGGTRVLFGGCSYSTSIQDNPFC